jgi:predicted esterase
MDRIAFVSMIADGRVLCESEFGFSVCYKLADSVAGLKKSLAAAKGRHDWLACTARDSLERIEGVLAGDVGDTDVPANMLLSQVQFLAENWATNNEKMEKFQEDFFVERLTSPGAHYLAFPAEKKRSHVVRVWIPENPEKKPRPLVVALHGAGGSENMFPEAYGHGQIAKECQARGWYLLCPHSGLAFGTSPVSAIVEEFAKQFPVDPKAVFLVGHSMGAAQAIAVVQDQPERFAAVAALGGGGRVSKPEAFKSIPVFIGVGDKDFALGGAKALAKSLPKAIYKEYPDFEHLVIVREALPDVFKEWDKLVKPRGPVKEN